MPKITAEQKKAANKKFSEVETRFNQANDIHILERAKEFRESKKEYYAFIKPTIRLADHAALKAADEQMDLQILEKIRKVLNKKRQEFSASLLKEQVKQADKLKEFVKGYYALAREVTQNNKELTKLEEQELADIGKEINKSNVAYVDQELKINKHELSNAKNKEEYIDKNIERLNLKEEKRQAEIYAHDLMVEKAKEKVGEAKLKLLDIYDLEGNPKIDSELKFIADQQVREKQEKIRIDTLAKDLVKFQRLKNNNEEKQVLEGRITEGSLPDKRCYSEKHREEVRVAFQEFDDARKKLAKAEVKRYEAIERGKQNITKLYDKFMKEDRINVKGVKENMDENLAILEEEKHGNISKLIEAAKKDPKLGKEMLKRKEITKELRLGLEEVMGISALEKAKYSGARAMNRVNSLMHSAKKIITR